MNTHRRYRIGFFLLIFIALFFCMRLMNLRFKAGDIYPVYSSLRSDPLGTKVLFESLKKVHGITVDRNFEHLYRLNPLKKDVTLFIIGLSTNSPYFSIEDLKKLETLIFEGARVVVSWPWRKGEDKHFKEVSIDHDAETAKDFYTHFKLGIDLIASSNKPLIASLDPKAPGHMLPSKIQWHSELSFRTDRLSGHRIIYAYNSIPLMIQIKMGKGDLIVLSESYLFSNEGISEKSHPGLFTYLIGKSTHVIFNETHLSLVKSRGIAKLISQYRLTGLVLGLFLFALVFIFKHTVSLVPETEGQKDEKNEIVHTHWDHLSGLSGLYRQNILKSKVIEVCLKEYRRTARTDHLKAEGHLNNLDHFMKENDIIKKSKTDALSTYHSIARFIAKERLK